MNRHAILSMCLLLGGCGADVATTAATAAAGKAEEAKQAVNTQERIQRKLDDAMTSGEQRLRDAEQMKQ